MRLQKAIVMYSEHINDYKQCPSLVDKTESFLISGTHCYCIFYGIYINFVTYVLLLF